MLTKKRNLVELVAILGLLLFAGACPRGRDRGLVPPVKVEVPPPAAPRVTLIADPGSIQSGNSVILSWTSQNATDLDLQPGIGKVQATGSTSVTPKDSTTFTLTAAGPGGTVTATARISVIPAPPPEVTSEPPAAHVTDEEMFTTNIKDAYFDYDQADIRADAEQALTLDANFLKEHVSTKFTIEGHCDERGSEEYNLGLGDRRANAAKNFLINAGVSADRISTISYGNAQPICTEQTEECWQKNRRAHFHQGGESK